MTSTLLETLPVQAVRRIADFLDAFSEKFGLWEALPDQWWSAPADGYDSSDTADQPSPRPTFFEPRYPVHVRADAVRHRPQPRADDGFVLALLSAAPA